MSKTRDEYIEWGNRMMYADNFPPAKYIKELEAEKVELIECLTLTEEAYRLDERIPIVSIRKLIEKLQKEN